VINNTLNRLIFLVSTAKERRQNVNVIHFIGSIVLRDSILIDRWLASVQPISPLVMPLIERINLPFMLKIKYNDIYPNIEVESVFWQKHKSYSF
jgi:hypothetical protein